MNKLFAIRFDDMLRDILFLRLAPGEPTFGVGQLQMYVQEVALMGSESGFFLSPFLIKELVKWRRSTGENIASFEPVARSCTAAAQALAHTKETAEQIEAHLKKWCSSVEFEALILSCNKTRRNLWLDEAGEHFRSITFGKEDGATAKDVGGVQIENVLSALSALLRTELRIWDSRSSGRIDEIFVWQRELEHISSVDFAFWLLCHLIESTGASVYDKLKTLAQKGVELNVAPVPNDDLQLRPALMAAIGHAAFGGYKESNGIFKKTLDIPGVDPSYGRVSQALVAFMSGDSVSAQRQILTESATGAPGIIHAARILIFGASILSAESATIFGGKDEDPSNNQESHRCDELCAQALAVVHIENGEFGKAEELLSVFTRENACDGPDSAFTFLLLAESILVPIRQKFFNDPPLPGAPQQDYPARLKVAREYLERAENICTKEVLSHVVSRARINLSSTLIFLRKFKDALSLLNTVLAAEPDNVPAILNKTATLLLLGMLPQIYQCVEPLRNWDAVTAGRMVADACYHTGDFSEALRFWSQILEHERDRLWQMRAVIRQLEIFRMLRNQKDAQTCTDALLLHFRSEPEALFALGCELVQIGENKQAIDLLDAAKAAGAPNLKRWVAWELARIHVDEGKTLSATDEYGLTADRNVDSPQAREFIVALYQAGLLPAAHERAVALRKAGGAIIPGITEIEVEYLMQDEQFDAARSLLLELARLRPLSIMNRIALIQLHLKLREVKEARKELDEINVSRLSDELLQQVLNLEEQLQVLSPESSASPY